MVAVAGVPGEVATPTMILGRLATLWFAVVVGFVALGWLGRRRFPDRQIAGFDGETADRAPGADAKTLPDAS